ncbi:MAG: transglutaminase domain-containing protein [Candidatus Thorarchaeota archaeon]
MSDLRDEILGAGINKKRIIGVALIAMLLIGIFAFSMTLFSFLFGTQRPNPSKEKAETDPEDVELVDTPYPFDEDFWQDLLDQVDDPASLLDMLSEMLDGNIDDLDLGNFSQGLLDLLYSGAGEIEIFRVYNYLSFFNMSDVLWKFESFDEYTGDGWTSNAVSNLYDFYSYGDYLANYFPDPELLKIKMPISPDIGANSMVLPTLFPTPYVLNEINPPYQIATNPNTLVPGSPTLYKNEYNSTTIDLSFSSDVDVNMTFNMFGYYNHLPSNDDLNDSAVYVTNPSAEYLSLQNKYLQLPPTIGVYKTNNPFFTNHFNILNNKIKPNEQAFWVANIIRNYLQTQFSFPMSPTDFDPAPDGRDIVDWFCETEQGLWSDFASAFCAFARAFGVLSRFVDGFNSLMIEEFWDNDESQWGFAIKYKNLYNWAEIYVPTDIYGNGKWVQFDIFDSYGGGGSPIIGGNYNITVSTDQPSYIRPDTATISARVSSNTNPIDNLTITFRDYTTGRVFGEDNTDLSGFASIQTDFNGTDIVGPHLIEARYDFFNAGYNLTTILGNIAVDLTDLNPGELNVSDSQPDITNVGGLVYDPKNGKGVEGPELNIRLFRKGTNSEILSPFSPSAINTTYNGNFNDFLDLNYNNAGNYEIRADLNGTWWIDTPFGTYSYSFLSFLFQVPYYYMTNSSNRLDFNITKALDVWFYIDGLPSNYPNLPPNYVSVSRYHDLNLTAQVVSVTMGPISNKRVFFYDYSRGDILIGSDISDANGFATINYPVGDNSSAGPNLLYARIGLQENYSYYVLNEKPTINIISGPTPRIINRTGSGATEFNIVGEIYDSTNNSLPISFSEIRLLLLRSGVDYSSYLVPYEGYPYQTDSTGTFDLTFGVAPNTPPGNYTLRLDFNGTIDLSSFPYSFQFNLPFINTSTYFSNDLQIDAPATLQFNFWINGIPSNDPFSPVINRYDDLTLTVLIQYSGMPIDDGEWVYFYDISQDNLLLGSAQTVLGQAQIIYSTVFSTTAGPHLIYATWNNKYNYSYFILDAPINVNLDICPQPREINRSGSNGRNFLIHGYLNDLLNGNPIKFAEIDVFMYDGPIDVSFYLNLESGSLQLGSSGEIDLIYSVSSSTPAKNYTLQVEFNGIFFYTNPNYPQFFNLWYISNFTNTAPGFNDLRVIDPNDVEVNFFVDGNPTQSFYSDLNPPEIYNRGANINFSVYILQSGLPVSFGTVSFTDIYTGAPLGSGSVNSGWASMLVDTSSWHAGLHQIRAQWSGSDTINMTYVIINEYVNIFSNVDQSSILRNVDNFIVSGSVRENGEFLRGLNLNIVLLDNTFSDVSGLYLNGGQTLTINDGGTFQFLNSIDLSCPQGDYYINITFTGGINAPGISMSDFMVHNSSLLISIDVLASTYIVGSYETNVVKDDWYYGDECYVYGNLYWDNGTAMAFMEINVTITDSMGAILATQVGLTDINGFFNLTFIVGAWDDDTEVWINFYPDDPVNFGIPDGLYIIATEQEVFRQV